MTIPGEVADGNCSFNALNTRAFALLCLFALLSI